MVSSSISREKGDRRVVGLVIITLRGDYDCFQHLSFGVLFPHGSCTWPLTRRPVTHFVHCYTHGLESLLGYIALIKHHLCLWWVQASFLRWIDAHKILIQPLLYLNQLWLFLRPLHISHSFNLRWIILWGHLGWRIILSSKFNFSSGTFYQLMLIKVI